MFGAIDKAVTVNGWKIITLLRLSPITPFNILNYALSLTKIKFWEYTWASALGFFFSVPVNCVRNVTTKYFVCVYGYCDEKFV
jgi:uncharacterized membrane protein YdjX (TVP38/TMEM64 family)